jgi:hypothetical protein
MMLRISTLIAFSLTITAFFSLSGCHKSKPSPANVLKPVSFETDKKSVTTAIPNGIESPTAKSPATSDKAARDKVQAILSNNPVTAKPKENAKATPQTSRVAEKSAQKSGKTEIRNTSPTPTVTTQSKTASSAVQPSLPVVPAAVPETKPAKKTLVVPSSAHVRAEVPAGLQKLLDSDQRMQPWVNKVMEVAEQCYAKVRGDNASAEGAIAVNVVMHENERPDASIASLPSQLAGMVTCGTSKLMRTRMPFFTGDEGAHFTVRLRFSR